MSQKSSNKTNSAKRCKVSWYYCELCNVNISFKEREQHELNCPIKTGELRSPSGEPLEYIQHNTLYTASIEKRKFVIEELKDLPDNVINQLVFISEGVIRLAGWRIGQNIVISAVDKQEALLIRSVWPISDKFLTTILVNEEDFNLYWSPFSGSVFQLKPLPKGQPLSSSTVSLQLINDELNNDPNSLLTQIQLKDLTRVLKRQLNNCCFTQGSKIYCDFFNKSLWLQVQTWKDRKHEDLEVMFNKLTTEEKVVFKINNATRLDVTMKVLDTDCNRDSGKYVTKREDIGGLNKQLDVIEEALDHAMGLRSVPTGVKISRGLLLYGPSGCGKTMICEALANRIKHQLGGSVINPLILKLNTGELFSKFLGESEKKLCSYFQQVYTHYPNPTLIIIEDVQNLCSKNESNEVAKRVSLAFLKMLDDLSSRWEGQKSFVLATTAQLDDVSASLRRSGRLDIELEISAPTPNERKDILGCILRKIPNHQLCAKDVEELAQITHAYVGADLANVIYNASLRALKRCCNSFAAPLTADDVKVSLTTIKPSAMREVLIECPNVRWSDIGGQDKLKLLLQQAIDWPFKHAKQFQKLGIKPPRGILMYGPPGCSKTMIAKAVATESRLNFLSIKGPELFSMWVGESERAVREVFRKARQVAPAIVFFDEIDAIGGERTTDGSGSGTSVKERVLTQLLTELDGVESLQNVTIIAATNRPDLIDKALLRPGRIDRIIYVGLPNESARREIFNIKLRKMPLAEDVDVQQLVSRTDGYSGAEIEAVCHEAAFKALEQSLEADQVCWPQFEYALNAVKPRTSAELLRLYDNYGKEI